MKVLHFIPDHLVDHSIAEDSKMMATALSNKVEMHILSFHINKPLTEKEGVYYHFLKKKNAVQDFFSIHYQYVAILYQIMPDIVHIHGCWNYLGACIEEWSRKRGFRVVLTPHGLLRHFCYNIDYFKTRWWQNMVYQRAMIRRVVALHVHSEGEFENIRQLKLNRNITLIQHGDNEQWIEKMVNLYQKVLNANISCNLTQRESNAICVMLHAATAGKQLQIDNIQKLQIHQLSNNQWKNILLYANEEHITSLLYKGTERLQATIPDIDEALKEQFAPLQTKSSENLQNEDGLLSMLADAKQRVKKRTLSLRQLTELYQAFLMLDTDEILLKRHLRKKNLYRFTARMLQILSETFALSEGFMPIAQRNDCKTEKIRKSIMF